MLLEFTCGGVGESLRVLDSALPLIRHVTWDKYPPFLAPMSSKDNYKQELIRAGVYVIKTWEDVPPHGGERNKSDQSHNNPDCDASIQSLHYKVASSCTEGIKWPYPVTS